MARMAVSMTLEQVRARTKFETRRRVDSWRNLKPGDIVTLIEKGMGLPKGAKQVVVCDVEITAVDVVNLYDITEADVMAEGFPGWTTAEFCSFWLGGHGYRPTSQNEAMAVECRRIRWCYLETCVHCGHPIKLRPRHGGTRSASHAGPARRPPRQRPQLRPQTVENRPRLR